MITTQGTATMAKKLLPANDAGYVVGENHHRAKRTDHEVDLALELVADGMSQRQVAEKMEVSRWTVRRWVNGTLRGHTPTQWVHPGAHKGKRRK
jgi:DNA-binding NarL/FixJ family response regulator